LHHVGLLLIYCVERHSTVRFEVPCALSVYVARTHARVTQCTSGVSAFLQPLCVCVFVSISLLIHNVSKCQEDIQRASFLPVTN